MTISRGMGEDFGLRETIPPCLTSIWQRSPAGLMRPHASLCVLMRLKCVQPAKQRPKVGAHLPCCRTFRVLGGRTRVISPDGSQSGDDWHHCALAVWSPV